MIQELLIYQQREITITPARFVVGSQTYAIRGITSVRGIEITPSKLEPLGMIAGGIIFLIGNFYILIRAFLAGATTEFTSLIISSLILTGIGSLLVFGGYKWLKKQKSTFMVVLTTAAGELSAFQSQDSIAVGDVLEALNRAIAKS